MAKISEFDPCMMHALLWTAWAEPGEKAALLVPARYPDVLDTTLFGLMLMDAEWQGQLYREVQALWQLLRYSVSDAIWNNIAPWACVCASGSAIAT